MHEAGSPEDLPSPPPAKSGDDHPYAIFPEPGFTLYLAGRLVAVLGQQMFAMALAGKFMSAPVRRWPSLGGADADGPRVFVHAAGGTLRTTTTANESSC